MARWAWLPRASIMRGLVSALAGRGRCCLTVAPRTSALRPVHLDGCTLPLVGGQGDGARSAHSGAGRWHTTADTSAQTLTTVSAAGSVARLGATARCSLHAGGSTGAGRLVGDSAGAHNRARVRWAHASAVVRVFSLSLSSLPLVLPLRFYPNRSSS